MEFVRINLYNPRKNFAVSYKCHQAESYCGNISKVVLDDPNAPSMSFLSKTVMASEFILPAWQINLLPFYGCQQKTPLLVQTQRQFITQ